MNDVQPLLRRTRRLHCELRRWAALPIKVGRLLAQEGMATCIERIRLRMSRATLEPGPIDRYEQWRAENEGVASAAARCPDTSRIAVLLLLVQPTFERLERVWQALEAQAGGGPASEMLAVVACDDPAVRQLVKQWAVPKVHATIRVVDDERRLVAEVNNVLASVRSEHVLLTDGDCVLAEGTLQRLAATLEAHADCAIVYGDHDALDDNGNRVDPFFKPDYSPELLHSFNYIGATVLLRRSLLDEAGGFRDVGDRAYVYDLLLRALERSPGIHHLREILCHLLPEGIAAPTQPTASVEALSTAFVRRGVRARVVSAGSRTECRFERASDPLVSIIVPSDDAENSVECISRLLAGTGYENVEVLLVTNSTVARHVDAAFDAPHVRCVIYDRPFNFSDKCNAGASAARGAYLVFFNDDVAPLASDWIEALLEYAGQPGIGGVSPKMLYENGTIQYAGMVAGVRDFVGTAFHAWEADDERYHGLANSVRNVSILCGACLMVSRSAFDAIGGWDARHTPIAHSDLAFSFDLSERGYRLVYTPLVAMRHVGAKSRHNNVTWRHLDDDAHYYVLQRYGRRLSDDPYFSYGMRAMLYDDRSQFRVFASDALPDAAAREPRRILLIAHELSLSGAPMVVLEVARHLKQHGCGVCVVSPRDGKLRASFEQNKIPVIVDEWILRDPRRCSSLWASFDLVVPNTVLGWKCILEAARLGKPNVFLVHESDFGVRYVESQKGAAGAFAAADAVVFSSAKTLQLYADYRRAAPHYEIRYGIHDIAKTTARIPFSRAAGKVRIVHSGTVESRKGQDLLIEAVRRLPRAVCDRIEVHLLGRDDDPAGAEFVGRLKQEAAGLPIRFVGELPREEALAYLAASDLFVCTSTEETGPLVVFEAMALSKPVVTTRVGAAVQVVAEGESGFVIDVGDVEALCELLKTLVLADETVRAQLGRAGRRIFEGQLTIETYGARLGELFERVLANRGVGRRVQAVSRAA